MFWLLVAEEAAVRGLEAVAVQATRLLAHIFCQREVTR
jgi:hypothetical protein